MLKLCGFSASNYYNKVKLSLLEKGVPFEEELVWMSQSPQLLAKSPLGKLPYLETEQGCVCESQVIAEYIEATYPEKPMLPTDPFAASKVREIITYLEWYLEMVAREVYGAALFGGTVSDETKAAVKQKLQRNVEAFGNLVKFSPYIAGNEFTLADCAAVFHFGLMGLALSKIYEEDLLAPLNLGPYLKLMDERPHVQKAKADLIANFNLMMSGK